MVLSHLSPSSHARPTWPALLIAFSVSVLFITPRASAQLKDVAGSKDHPTIKRYEGSAILGYDFKKFDEYGVLLGPVKAGKISTDLSPTKDQKVEGQVTRILYVAPRRSPRMIPIRGVRRTAAWNWSSNSDRRTSPSAATD
jgi:hypothetical protein